MYAATNQLHELPRSPAQWPAPGPPARGRRHQCLPETRSPAAAASCPCGSPLCRAGGRGGSDTETQQQQASRGTRSPAAAVCCPCAQLQGGDARAGRPQRLQQAGKRMGQRGQRRPISQHSHTPPGLPQLQAGRRKGQRGQRRPISQHKPLPTPPAPNTASPAPPAAVDSCCCCAGAAAAPPLPAAAFVIIRSSLPRASLICWDILSRRPPAAKMRQWRRQAGVAQGVAACCGCGTSSSHPTGSHTIAASCNSRPYRAGPSNTGPRADSTAGGSGGGGRWPPPHIAIAAPWVFRERTERSEVCARRAPVAARVRQAGHGSGGPLSARRAGPMGSHSGMHAMQRPARRSPVSWVCRRLAKSIAKPRAPGCGLDAGPPCDCATMLRDRRPRAVGGTCAAAACRAGPPLLSGPCLAHKHCNDVCPCQCLLTPNWK